MFLTDDEGRMLEGELVEVDVTASARSPATPRVADSGAGFLVRFGLAGLGSGIETGAVTVLFVYFATEVVGLRPALAGLIAFAPRTMLVVVDPAIGVWSDRLKLRRGGRRGMLLIGGALYAGSLAVLFSIPPSWSHAASVLALTIAYSLNALGGSLFGVPYMTMPAELHDDPTIRTRLVAARMTALFLGLTFGAGCGPLLVEAFGGGAPGFRMMGLSLAGISLVCIAATALSIADRTAAAARERPSGLAAALSGFREPAFRGLAAAYLPAMIASGCASGAVAYFAVSTLGGSEVTAGILMLVLLVFGSATGPLWARFAEKVGRSAALLVALGLYVVGYASVGLVPVGAPLARAVPSFLAMGAALCGQQTLSFALLAELIRGPVGAARAGAVTGAWSAIEKIGLALGPFVLGLILGVGWSGSATDLPVGSVRTAIAWVPAALAAVSLLLMVFWSRRWTRALSA